MRENEELEEAEIIDFDLHRSKINALLAKGDVVRYVEEHKSYEGKTGIVLRVHSYGRHGQAENIDIAFPHEDGWQIVEDVEVNKIHRCIGPDSRQLRKKTLHPGMEWDIPGNE